MKSDKILKVLNWILLLIIVIISLVSYKYLPDKVALHINISGKLSNFVSKNIAALVAPAIVFLLNLYSSFIDKEGKAAKHFLVSLIIIAAHVFLIYSNIKA